MLLSFRCYLLLLGLLLAGCASGRKEIKVSPAEAEENTIPPVVTFPPAEGEDPPPATGGDDVVIGDGEEPDECEVEDGAVSYAYGTLKKDKSECECEGNQGNGKGKGKCKKEGEDDSE